MYSVVNGVSLVLDSLLVPLCGQCLDHTDSGFLQTDVKPVLSAALNMRIFLHHQSLSDVK